MKKNGMRPVPPDEILDEEFLKPLGMIREPNTSKVNLANLYSRKCAEVALARLDEHQN